MSVQLLLAIGVSWLAVVAAHAAEDEENDARPSEQLPWITADGRTARNLRTSRTPAEMFNRRWGLRSGPLFSGACAGPLDLIGTLTDSSLLDRGLAPRPSRNRTRLPSSMIWCKKREP